MGGFGSGRARGSGGRQPGAKNVITEKVKGDLLAVYKQLGGRRWLLTYARTHEDEFVKHLMRLLPAPPREDTELPDATLPAPDSLFDSARRIAFILAVAQHEQEARTTEVEMVEMAPAPEPESPFPYRPTLDELPERQDPLPEQQDPLRASAPPTSDTLETFRGNAAEQGRACDRPEVIDARRKAHDTYVSRLSTIHRRSLL